MWVGSGNFITELSVLFCLLPRTGPNKSAFGFLFLLRARNHWRNKAKPCVLGAQPGCLRGSHVQFVCTAERFSEKLKLQAHSQNRDAVQSISVCHYSVVVFFAPAAEWVFRPKPFSVLLVSCQFPNDEKCCSLEWPNSATAAPGSVPALLSMINLVCATCGRVAVVTITKTLCLLLRYGTTTLKQAVLSIPDFPFFFLPPFWRHISEMRSRVPRLFSDSESSPNLSWPNSTVSFFFLCLNNVVRLVYFQ